MRHSSTVPWWDRIKNKLIISLSAVLVFSLILLGLICAISFKMNIIEQISNKNKQLSTNIKDGTDLFLSSIMNDLSSLAGTLGEEGDLWGDQQQEILDRYVKKMPDVDQLTLLDNQGKECVTVFKQTVDLARGGREASGRTEQEKTALQENLFVSPVYPSYRAVPMIDVVMPVRNFADNRVRGTIKAGVSLCGLWTKISSVKSGPETTIYLIDKNGKLIAHSDIGLVSTAIDFSHIKKVKQFIFGASQNDLGAPLIYAGNKNTEVVGVATSIDRMNWGVVVEESLDSALSPYYRIRRIIFSSLAALVFLASITLGLFVIRFTRSIDTLTRQADAISEEEHSPSIEVDSKDEISHLAEIINRMQKQLWEKNEKLKRRYKELEAIHDEFRESYDELEQVSEKLEASQSELHKQKEFEKQLIETANILIVVLNQNGEIILCNRKCEEVTGYSKNFILGKSWLQLMPPSEGKEEYIGHFHASLQNRCPSIYECPIVTHDGAVRIIAWHSNPTFDKANNIIGILNVGEDVTDEKSLQQELETKNRALEEKNEELQNFVSIVSHDLKNPLYVIKYFADTLLREHKTELGEDVIDYLERIRKNAEITEKLVRDILDFSEIGTSEGEYQNYPISQLVQQAVDGLRPKIDEKNIRLVISSQFPSLYCNPHRITQVFMNLVSNAIKFMDTKKEALIEIGCAGRDGEYEFFVRDNGIGIEKEYHEKVFQMFQRLKELKHVEGTGVGLSIVKKIIENHGGRVWLDSEKGKGSTFYFTLPAKRQ
ncbi:MAG: ATP-binding protein [bacterium]